MFSRELKPSRIRRNALDLKNIINLLQQTMNPFSSELDKDSLFNIGSGKATSEETKNFLLTVANIGQNPYESVLKIETDLSKNQLRE